MCSIDVYQIIPDAARRSAGSTWSSLVHTANGSPNTLVQDSSEPSDTLPAVPTPAPDPNVSGAVRKPSSCAVRSSAVWDEVMEGSGSRNMLYVDSGGAFGTPGAASEGGSLEDAGVSCCGGADGGILVADGGITVGAGDCAARSTTAPSAVSDTADLPT